MVLWNSSQLLALSFQEKLNVAWVRGAGNFRGGPVV